MFHISGGPGISDFVSNLHSLMIGLTEYLYTVDLLSVAPHHMGVTIHNVDVQTKVSYEDMRLATR